MREGVLTAVLHHCMWMCVCACVCTQACTLAALACVHACAPLHARAVALHAHTHKKRMHIILTQVVRGAACKQWRAPKSGGGKRAFMRACVHACMWARHHTHRTVSGSTSPCLCLLQVRKRSVRSATHQNKGQGPYPCPCPSPTAHSDLAPCWQVLQPRMACAGPPWRQARCPRLQQPGASRSSAPCSPRSRSCPPPSRATTTSYLKRSWRSPSSA